MTLVVVEMLNEEEHKGGIGNESDTVNTMEQTILQQDGDDLNASNANTFTFLTLFILTTLTSTYKMKILTI